MIVIALTHAAAQPLKEGEWDQFRALDPEVAPKQVAQATNRFRQVMEDVAPSLASGTIFINSVISSPAARCLDTAIRVAAALRQFTKTSEVIVSNNLAEQKGAKLCMSDLQASLRGLKGGAVLLCAHGDLVAALPNPETYESLWEEKDGKKDRFFRSRPALVVFEYDVGTPDGIKVKFCEMLEKHRWIKPQKLDENQDTATGTGTAPDG